MKTVKLNTQIKRILYLAFFLRFLVLLILFLSNDKKELGYNSDYIINDDIRYEKGAKIYARTATSLIDKTAFSDAYEQLGDYVGYSSDFSIWYWIVCVTIYIFKYGFVMRLLNILFGVLTVLYLYKFALIVSNKKIAKYSAVFYAVNPYFIFFSCFLYKDQFLTLIILLIFYYFFEYLYRNHKTSILIKLILFLVVFAVLRSGFVVFVCLCLFIMYLYYRKKLGYSLNLYFIFFTLFFGVMFSYALINSVDQILIKYTAYIVERENSLGNLITFFQINDYSQVYKYPITLVFALIQPVNFSAKINSISMFVGSINFFAIPLAVSNFLYLFSKPLKKDLIYWVIQLLFLITLMTSLGISRHYYFMLPFFVYFFIKYLLSVKQSVKKLTLSSLGLFFILLFVYLYKI